MHRKRIRLINYRSIIMLIIYLLVNQRVIAEKISIKGIDIFYNESTSLITASGNAEIHHPDFTVYADTITYNENTKIMTGVNNVEMIQKNQIILSDRFDFNTETNELNIDNLTIELSTKNKKSQVFATALKFSDKPSKKIGKDGIITTCDHFPPHYYVESKDFTIYPEKRIIGQNTTLVNPIYLVPFGFWTPAYIFELGKRKIIYLMPVIGSNKIEGGFIKNQFDYVLNENYTGKAYIDYVSEKGVGLGTTVSYDNYDNFDGSIYYYGIIDSEDNIKEWKQSLKLSPEKKISTYINAKNIYKISGGKSLTDKHSVTYTNAINNNTGEEKAHYEFSQNNSNSIKPKNYTFKYEKATDDGNELSIALSKSEATKESNAYTIKNKQTIGYNIESKNDIHYSSQDISSSSSTKDSYLRTKNTLSKKFEWGSLSSSIDYLIDTDFDEYDDDITDHVVQKIPELNLNLQKLKMGDHWSFQNKLQYGYYTEYYYNESEGEVRGGNNSGYAQSRFVLDQTINSNYKFNFLNGNFKTKTSYVQYNYSTGDQNYTLNNTTTYETDTFSFIKTKTSHEQSFIPENGNTPFYFDEKNQIEKNELDETIIFYLINPLKYQFSYSSGYNWITDKQKDNKMKLTIKPNQTYEATFSTIYRIQNKIYTDLVSALSYKPSKKFETTVKANYDLNEGKMKTLTHILKGETGSSWEDRLTYKATFTYKPNIEQDYQLQTLELIKDFHCRELSLSYNLLREEYRFQFTINAFPNNNIGIKTNKEESFKLEGILDDKSIQR